MTLGTVAPAALAAAFPGTIGYAVEYGCTGIATMIVIYALGEVSGAHTNPITTLAFALRGDVPWARVPEYVVTQFAGAVAAGGFVVAVFHPARKALLPELSFGPWAAFGLEIVLTTILIAVAIATANQGKIIGAQSAVANGATTVFDRWISGPVSGGSMNPARTLGPAVVAGGFGAWWVYLAAPLLGGLLGVVLVGVLYGQRTDAEERKSGG